VKGRPRSRPRGAKPSDNAPRSREAATALRAAIVAGNILSSRFLLPRQISFKGYRDIVTDADFASDTAIRSILRRAFPDYAIMSEEDASPPRHAEYTWMIDPLDGTTNYSRRMPIFSVSIALTRRGQPLVGVVYDPLRKESYFAERGGGSYLNGVRVNASKVRKFEDALVGFELARDQELRKRGLNWFAALATKGMTARIGGSAALSLCYIGSGRLDTYLQLSLHPWDVAAGILIAREGGGRVTHLDGQPATLRGGAYLAGNPFIFPQLLEDISALNKGLTSSRRAE
jgi:myo-inositol-1(or 4)-monophosphatase